MKSIPVTAAKTISQAYDAPIVIVFGLDPATGKQHVTTYGNTVALCEAAARGGNILKEHLGWPAELCKAVPARGRLKKVKTAPPLEAQSQEAANLIAMIKIFHAQALIRGYCEQCCRPWCDGLCECTVDLSEAQEFGVNQATDQWHELNKMDTRLAYQLDQELQGN